MRTCRRHILIAQVRLQKLFAGYAEMPPTAFVFCGNFINNSSTGVDYNNSLKVGKLLTIPPKTSWLLTTRTTWVNYGSKYVDCREIYLAKYKSRSPNDPLKFKNAREFFFSVHYKSSYQPFWISMWSVWRSTHNKLDLWPWDLENVRKLLLHTVCF